MQDGYFFDTGAGGKAKLQAFTQQVSARLNFSFSLIILRREVKAR